MTKITINYPCGEHEFFYRNAFDRSIGKVLFVKGYGKCKIVEAVVAKDQRSVDITFEQEIDHHG